MNRRLYSWAAIILIIIYFVVTVEIAYFFDKATSNSKFLRKSILLTANIVIPLKNKILGRDAGDHLAQLISTGVCQFCDLTEVSMKNGYFNGDGAIQWEIDMRNSNLSRANLSGVQMPHSKLNNTILVEANLIDAELYMSNLSGSNLKNANMTGAKISLATLNDANLSGANLTKANLEWCSSKGSKSKKSKPSYGRPKARRLF